MSDSNKHSPGRKPPPPPPPVTGMRAGGLPARPPELIPDELPLPPGLMPAGGPKRGVVLPGVMPLGIPLLDVPPGVLLPRPGSLPEVLPGLLAELLPGLLPALPPALLLGGLLPAEPVFEGLLPGLLLGLLVPPASMIQNVSTCCCKDTMYTIPCPSPCNLWDLGLKT